MTYTLKNPSMSYRGKLGLDFIFVGILTSLLTSVAMVAYLRFLGGGGFAVIRSFGYK